ncbi:replication protein [Jinshanibacter sp. LJY008]|uniref:Replication protein n=1 Tax=Limnobaculum eriocheiris TaxID=2897391 RepID=A0A9X1SJQ6_9GAMM|nr:replication protein P [Limnobaculum eriocheiris]MCD1124835.1 replication protein [Limnobaculum eriocheiris]
MTEQQLKSVTQLCVNRCMSGNSWVPDLAEFMALMAETGANSFGLTQTNVMEEYQRWRRDGYLHGTSEQFPWRHPVLYQICTEMRSLSIGRNPGYSELSSMAGKLLAKWIQKVGMGYSVPPVRKALDAPKHEGLTPAQQLAAGVRYVK